MALRRLIKGRLLPHSVLKTQVAAISVGVMQDEPLLDLTYEEDSQAQVDFNVVMTAEGEYVEVQGTGEGGPFSRQMMDRLLELAQKGIEELLVAQKETLKGY